MADPVETRYAKLDKEIVELYIVPEVETDAGPSLVIALPWKPEHKDQWNEFRVESIGGLEVSIRMTEIGIDRQRSLFRKCRQTWLADLVKFPETEKFTSEELVRGYRGAEFQAPGNPLIR